MKDHYRHLRNGFLTKPGAQRLKAAAVAHHKITILRGCYRHAMASLRINRRQSTNRRCSVDSRHSCDARSTGRNGSGYAFASSAHRRPSARSVVGLWSAMKRLSSVAIRRRWRPEGRDLFLPHARAEKSPPESRIRLPEFGDGLRSIPCRIRGSLSSTATNSCFFVVSAAPGSP